LPAANHDNLWILAGLGAAWCLVFVSLLVMVFWRHKPPRFDFHWGSLGRGLGLGLRMGRQQRDQHQQQQQFQPELKY